MYMEKKHHYVYKITNNINGYFYYGKRSCNCPIEEDDYMGSGVRLHKAYKKYGIENFTKEIVSIHSSSEEAFKAESEIVTEELVNRQDCYNLKTGGYGGHYHFNEDEKRRISESVKEKLYTDVDLLQQYKENCLRNRHLAFTEEANEKRRQKCRIASTKYHHGRAGKRDNHATLNIWVLIDTETGERWVSYDGIENLPFPKHSIYTRISKMGVKDRIRPLLIRFRKGPKKKFIVIRIPSQVQIEDKEEHIASMDEIWDTLIRSYYLTHSRGLYGFLGLLNEENNTHVCEYFWS